jgi:hypothetical protein
VIPELKILLSGGSDKDLRVWDLASLEKEGWSDAWNDVGKEAPATGIVAQVGEMVEQVKTSLNILQGPSNTPTPFNPLSFVKSLKGQHTRPIEAIAYYGVMTVEDHNGAAKPTGRYAVWSADSMGRICIWEVYRDQSGIQASFKYTWLAHETAIYEIRMSEEEAWTGELAIQRGISKQSC